MNRTHLRRSLAAVATTIACLAVTATPASAAVHDFAITGGVIRITKAGGVDEPLQTFSSSCTNPTITIDLGTETSGASTTVTAFDSSHVESFFGSTPNVLVVLTRSTTTGGSPGTLTISTTGPHTITSMRVPIRAQMYNTTSCTPTGTAICTVGLILHLSGTTTSTTSGNSFSFTASTVGNVLAFPTCTSGPSQIVGGTADTTVPLTGSIST